MFTAKELQNIDAGYFSVIASGGCALTLQSKTLDTAGTSCCRSTRISEAV